MASLFYYKLFLISTVTTIAFVLASSQDNVIQSGCEIPSITQSNDQQNFNRSTKAALAEVARASLDFAINGTIGRLVNTSLPNVRSALSSCRDLLSLAIENLNSTFTPADEFQSVETMDDDKCWLCAAMANLQTCIDGFAELLLINNDVTNLVTQTLQKSTEYISNSLAIIYRLDNSSCANSSTSNLNKFDFTNEEHLASHGDNPSWLSSNDRRLLQDMNIKPDVVVAKDGSGNYRTITDALKAAPYSSNKRFVIYVKKGVYKEYVKVDQYKWNIMMVGDGLRQTVVTGNRSYGDGSSTFDSATFAVYGKGFIARDMAFINTAGPYKGQAVALLSTADQSVFYRCRINGYQDTLCIQSNRQFYRECFIYGTVDFIFGQGSAVIQKCAILVKRPKPGQGNVITANQRNDPRCNTGFAIHRSLIKAAEDLKGENTHLGRPLTNYSLTLFMQSYIESLVNPEGWRPRGNDRPASTIFFAEYKNKGPGADTKYRVKWPGVETNLRDNEARKYTVRSFINGDQWLRSNNISYDLDL